MTHHYELELQGHPLEYMYLSLSRGVNGGYDSRVQVVHQLADQDSVHDPLPDVIRQLHSHQGLDALCACGGSVCVEGVCVSRE